MKQTCKIWNDLLSPVITGTVISMFYITIVKMYGNMLNTVEQTNS